MCKIMAISNISKIPRDLLDEHLTALRDIVCVANNDGFGYALSWRDAVFSEKFVNPKEFKGMLKNPVEPALNHLLFNAGSDSISEGNYYPDETKEPALAVIAHGRTSTNYKGMPEYSHPFFNETLNSAFIHNGVVDVPFNHDFEDVLTTSNDSEWLAHEYWTKGVKGLLEVSGYFAFLNLKADGVLEVVKDDYASLFGAFSPDLEGYIFATTQYMITNYAEKFKLKVSKIVPITENVHAVIKANKVLSVEQFERVDMSMELSWEQKKAFKDYDSGKGYQGKSYGSDVKDVQTPKVIAGGKGSNAGKGPEVVDAGKNTVKTEKTDGTKITGHGTETIITGEGNYAFVSKVSGRMLTAWMATEGLSDKELKELEIFEGKIWEQWKDEELKSSKKGETALLCDYKVEDRAYPKKLLGQAELEEELKKQSKDPFYVGGYL